MIKIKVKIDDKVLSRAIRYKIINGERKEIVIYEGKKYLIANGSDGFYTIGTELKDESIQFPNRENPLE